MCIVNSYYHFSLYSLQADSSPRLTYLYPPPTQNIIANMANTIASVPKLYTQVKSFYDTTTSQVHL